MSAVPGPDLDGELRPAGSVLLPATKSKGTLTAIPSWACASSRRCHCGQGHHSCHHQSSRFHGTTPFFSSLSASKLYFASLGWLTVSAPQHAPHSDAFLRSAQCTSGEPGKRLWVNRYVGEIEGLSGPRGGNRFTAP